jgi:5-hydroxyisourate hydrolase
MGKGGLTTHVLDTAHGRPASGVPVRLFGREAGQEVPLAEALTNQDGRCDQPLLGPGALRPGAYRLEFRVADYFRAQGARLSDPPFLDVISIVFAVADGTAHYHVPLLVSPFGYSTYRGS